MILLIMVCNSYLQRTNISKQSTALDAKDDYRGWPYINMSFLSPKETFIYKSSCFQFSVFNIDKEMVLGDQIGTLDSFLKNWSNGFATAGISLIDPLLTQVLTYYSMFQAIYMALRMCIFVS